ncbi:MAG TPA: Mur ligase family protein, partial [Candidatus Polarisedimenticolaceae bacterium]|nr:Mur ligase family protein [Candidatus Polarisedimenticolaceae bacterium]
MKVAIIGYGVEGKSALEYWRAQGHQMCIHDANAELRLPRDTESHLGPDYLQGLDRYDLIVRSPGVRPQLILKANPGLNPTQITSGTNEFLANCTAKVIGVTGTKGKGTTTTLITRMLQAAGHTAHLGGNIGHPALDLLDKVNPEDWVVLELSSFQLIDIRYSPHVAVMLTISPDHLNWHPDMHEYLAGKQNIFAHQGSGDRAIYNACNLYSLQSGLAAPAEQIPYNATEGGWVDETNVKIGDTVICKTEDIALPGRHNWDNVSAAVTAVWPIIQDAKPIKQAILTFTGLEHRL